MQSELTLSLLLETKSLPPPPKPQFSSPRLLVSVDQDWRSPHEQVCSPTLLSGAGWQSPSQYGPRSDPAWKWEDCFQVAQLLTNSSRTGFSALQLISSSESNCFLRWRWTTETGAYQGERGGHCIMMTATNSLKCLMMPCHSLIWFLKDYVLRSTKIKYSCKFFYLNWDKVILFIFVIII